VLVLRLRHELLEGLRLVSVVLGFIDGANLHGRFNDLKRLKDDPAEQST
jgi:hypothetical protein